MVCQLSRMWLRLCQVAEHCAVNYTVPSVTAVTLIVNGREKYIYLTSALTQGGPGYSSNPTSVPMTVIYTMDTKRKPLPSGYL